jgi:hypothetical protein|nr:MAG TPA: hypothetical protein [Caudoviricetes sp.]
MSKSLSRKICELCGVKPKVIQDYELNDIVIYPDFENNNNNFVRLFELKLGNSDATLSQVLVDEYPIRDKKTFLISVLTCIKRCRILSNMITTSIRKTDWEV